MNLEIKLDEMARDIARRAMNETTYEGKTLREWINLCKAYAIANGGAPALDVQPVVHSRWIIQKGDNGREKIFCDECSTSLPAYFTDAATGKHKLPKYCHECGAKMDGGPHDP